MTLHDLKWALEGLIPPALTTVGPDGAPNIVRLSKGHVLDDRHLALTRQFFRKTAANLEANPRASLMLVDPASYDGYILELRYLRSETSGPVFEELKTELDALASLMGMGEVFALQAADVFEVERILAGYTPAEQLP